MPIILLGLQYIRRDNFLQLVVDGLTLSDQERDSLTNELTRRYPSWLNEWPAKREVTLEWSCPQIPSNARFTLLVVPAENERFKNIYLITSRPETAELAVGERSWLTSLFRASVRSSEGLMTKYDIVEREALRFVVNDLKQFLERESSHAALLLFLSAVGLREQALLKDDPHRGAFYGIAREFLHDKCKELLERLGKSSRAAAE